MDNYYQTARYKVGVSMRCASYVPSRPTRYSRVIIFGVW